MRPRRLADLLRFYTPRRRSRLENLESCCAYSLNMLCRIWSLPVSFTLMCRRFFQNSVEFMPFWTQTAKIFFAVTVSGLLEPLHRLHQTGEGKGAKPKYRTNIDRPSEKRPAPYGHK